MVDDDANGAPTPPSRSATPSPDRLAALPPDEWARVLVAARAALHALPARFVDRHVQRIRSLPVGRLVSGRGREDLVGLLQRDEVWRGVVGRLPHDLDLQPVEDPGEAGAAAREVERLEGRVDELGRTADELRDRLRDVRRERDRLVEDVARAERERDAADGRATGAEQRAGDLAEEVVRLSAEVEAAADERRRAVERARRRDAAEQRVRREELRDARRERDEARADVRRLREELERRPVVPLAERRPIEPRLPEDGRRGRPSTLPSDLVPGTRDATEWLLAPGVRLLVDGYNVTLTHRADLDLARQRAWLVDGLAALVARVDVDATVVFDARGGVASSTRDRRGITVRFTDELISADDELVFEVEAMEPDEPVVVVTDDRELRDRLQRSGPDLLRCRDLVHLLH